MPNSKPNSVSSPNLPESQIPQTPPDSDCSVSTSSKRSSYSSSPSTDITDPLDDLPRIPETSSSIEVLDIDKKTPDKHVPRDPRLIRLTGVHPFNVEAPLTDLFNEGFLTPAELFYVRNHGAVPEVLDSDVMDWELSIEGLVQDPFKVTLRQLLEDYDNVTYPVTLVCAGNRRKEQNVVKKTQGFSWGPAGLSNALFTGIAMRDVIKRAKPLRKARYVCMEGADKLPNGHYGTSVKLNWVMDPNRGIMLAHGMNAQPLSPDHGRPLRAIIPGQIGGRSVKWLTKIIITAEPSENWYHIYDNRVLPTEVTPEAAAGNEILWKDERHAIYDLSPNSAIVAPAHDEQLNLMDVPENYKLRGYAYSGGGRRITRVEISLNKGRSWTRANIDYPEDRYREAQENTKIGGGNLDTWWREACFSWCFWDLNVRIAELADAKDILVRSMDSGMAIQPRDMYWSVLGMMNNPWFRVAILREGDILRFEQPTQPALLPGGWMERVKKEGGDLLNGFWGEKLDSGDAEPDALEESTEKVKMTRDGVNRQITIDELRKHSTEEAPWFVVDEQVFDGAGFLQSHPGGAQSIISAAGADITDEFMAIHSETAKAMMPEYHIGTLNEKAKDETMQGGVQDENSEHRQVFLNSRSWMKATLHAKASISWDTKIFKFKLQHERQKLGLPTGQHLMMKLRDPITQETIIRSYTPISEQLAEGYMDVLVKLYLGTETSKAGKMSTALDQLALGHAVDFKGPIGKFEYKGNGTCSINGKVRQVQRFYMICGGSGITPIYQVIRAIMQNKNDKTKCTILYGNRFVEDILCREDLERYAAEEDQKCELLHTLTQAPEAWKGFRGRITATLIKEHCPRKSRTMVLICGPESMENSVKAALSEQEWADEDVLFF